MYAKVQIMNMYYDCEVCGISFYHYACSDDERCICPNCKTRCEQGTIELGAVDA